MIFFIYRRRCWFYWIPPYEALCIRAYQCWLWRVLSRFIASNFLNYSQLALLLSFLAAQLTVKSTDVWFGFGEYVAYRHLTHGAPFQGRALSKLTISLKWLIMNLELIKPNENSWGGFFLPIIISSLACLHVGFPLSHLPQSKRQVSNSWTAPKRKIFPNSEWP